MWQDNFWGHPTEWPQASRERLDAAPPSLPVCLGPPSCSFLTSKYHASGSCFRDQSVLRIGYVAFHIADHAAPPNDASLHFQLRLPDRAKEIDFQFDGHERFLRRTRTLVSRNSSRWHQARSSASSAPGCFAPGRPGSYDATNWSQVTSRYACGGQSADGTSVDSILPAGLRMSAAARRLLAARDLRERPRVGRESFGDGLAINEMALAPAGDQPGFAQNFEMMGDGCGGHATHGDDLATIHLARFGNRLEDPKASLCRQGLWYLLNLRMLHGPIPI